MSNQEFFLAPAKIVCQFILTLFNMTPDQIDLGVYQMFVIFLAIYIWAKFIGLCLMMIKKTFGFGH